MDNPIKSLRFQLGLSQGDLVKLSTLSKMVVLRTEQGLYKTPSKLITQPLIDLLANEITHKQIVDAYKIYQRYTQQSQAAWVRPLNQLPVSQLFEGPEHPIINFRRRHAPPVAKSRMGFCKAFCLHPNSMRIFESGEQLFTPVSLVVGLSNAELSPVALDTLSASVLQWARIQER